MKPIQAKFTVVCLLFATLMRPATGVATDYVMVRLDVIVSKMHKNANIKVPCRHIVTNAVDSWCTLYNVTPHNYLHLDSFLYNIYKSTVFITSIHFVVSLLNRHVTNKACLLTS